MHSHYCWEPVGAPGFEHCRVSFDPTLRADGIVLSVDGDESSRVRYRLRTDADFRTEVLRIDRFDPDPDADISDAAPPTSLSLTADGGSWTVDGDPAPELDGCLDVDVAVTPFTNTLPVRRLALSPGESATTDVVYVEPNGPEVSRAEQRYTRLSDDGEDRYRYESLTTGYTTTVTVDAAGVVRDYPGLFRRVR